MLEVRVKLLPSAIPPRSKCDPSARTPLRLVFRWVRPPIALISQRLVDAAEVIMADEQRNRGNDSPFLVKQFGPNRRAHPDRQVAPLGVRRANSFLFWRT